MNHRTKLTLAFLVLIFSTAFSQSVRGFQIHFESNVYTLSPNAQARIDSVIKLLSPAKKGYLIEIVGHADNVGSSSANYALSMERAEHTKTYFESKGFSGNDISVSAKGFSDPVDDNSTEEGKHSNRRVTITIQKITNKARTKRYQPVSIGGLTIKDSRYKFSATKWTTIKHPSGTTITVPPGVFVYKNGSPVSGEIEIVYCEYRDPVDFLLGGIPMDMIKKGELFHFSSAGMFKILANKKGTPVYLKKGETIKVDFPLVNKIPDLNFYSLDTISEKWSELAKITGPANNNRTVDPSGLARDVHGQASLTCTLGLCQGIKAGIVLSKHPEAIYTKLTETGGRYLQNKQISKDTLAYYADLANENKFKTDSVESLIKRETHVYRAKVIKNNSKRTIFTIMCNTRGNSELDAFANTSWKRLNHGNPPLNGKALRKNWAFCEITRSGEEYKIVLKDGAEEAAITHLQLKTGKLDKKKRETIATSAMDQYKAVNANYNNRMADLREINEYYEAEGNKIQSIIDSLNNIQIANDWIRYLLHSGTDNDTCFWSWSKSFMKENETSMNFKEWCNFFDANRTEMIERYSKLDGSYNTCIESRMTRRVVPMLSDNNGRYRLEKAQVNAITQSMNIPSLGVFNYDAIKRIQDPIEIVAKYNDTRGRTINPETIYILDNTLNGMIRYDGAGGYSPNSFVLSGSSRVTLIAFDQSMRAYICNSKRMEDIQYGEKQQVYTFVLERIDKLNSKEELKKML